jgi:hypothetical protein
VLAAVVAFLHWQLPNLWLVPLSTYSRRYNRGNFNCLQQWLWKVRRKTAGMYETSLIYTCLYKGYGHTSCNRRSCRLLRIPAPAYSWSPIYLLIFADHAKALGAIEGYHAALTTNTCDDNEQTLAARTYKLTNLCFLQHVTPSTDLSVYLRKLWWK